MQRRIIGGLDYSVVGLGAYELGADRAWSGARDVVAAAIDAGCNWIDTAEAYFAGMNERTVAAALASAAHEMRISTKVAPRPDGSGFEPDQVRNACRESLQRLEVERVDMYLLHWPDDTIAVEPTWEAMRGLVDQGFARLVGLSNFDRGLIERCLKIGPVDLVQDGLSPIDHLGHRDLFRWCRDQEVAVVTYEPLANGMLAGAITSPSDFGRVVDDYMEWGFWKRLFSPGRFERSEAVRDGMRAIAGRVGCTPAQLALAWNIHQSGITATLAGSRSPLHVRENADAGSLELTRADLAEIDALIPLGPLFDEGGS